MPLVRHVSVTQQTRDPSRDIHRDRWWSQRRADYFFLGVRSLPLASPTLVWTVLRGALPFAFVVGFLGRVFSSLSPSSWDAYRFFEGVSLGLPPPHPLDLLYPVVTV